MDSPSVEAIKNQEKLIEKEIAEKIPYVSKVIPIEELKNDYPPDDNVYQSKIEKLLQDYKSLRRTRPDGNCFFRAFAFGYLESLLTDDDELHKFIEYTHISRDELIELGLPRVTVDDFYEMFLEELTDIKKGKIRTSEQLLERFCDKSASDYIVVYFRLMTSGYLQKNAETFSNFIVGASNIQDFCKAEVEPMYRESDHIHVVALTSALNVRTRIIYMDRGSTVDTVNAHDFPEQDQPTKPRIHLLYRPGHYDVLYVR